MSDVLILGAGVIGLAIAVELAGRGAKVKVVDRGFVGRGASWAAGGMLAPFTEDLPPGELRDLAVESLNLYPDFAAKLLETSGVDVQLQLSGILDVAYEAGRVEVLRERVRRLRAEGRRAEYLERDELYAHEGALGAGALSAAYSIDEGQVENRRLGRALRGAAEALGVHLAEECEVLTLETNSRRVLGIRTAHGFMGASIVVNALGAWSGAVPGLPPELQIPVRPVKGQILALAMPKEFLRRVVWANGVYLIPRQDGRLVVGATVEDAGFDHRITAGGVQQLLNGVLATLPGAAAFALSETWVGHRPASPEDQLFLGATALDGYFVASGHYRNGILLAPITAKRVAEAVCAQVLEKH
jgi:glycine oxidase